MELAPGTRVGRYIVEERLGAGGAGEVFRVVDERAGTTHALKVLSTLSSGQRARLLREGHTQSTLCHPNIVRVTDFVTVGRRPGIVMEHIDGPDLATLIRTQTVSVRGLDAVVRGILSGVHAAHCLGLVHRDLKPSNILLARAGDGYVPKVADFGLVLVDNDHRRTRTGQPMGTPSYMAPEQIRDAKRVDQRADIWALGAILYELVTRQRAFRADNLLSLFLRIADGAFTPVGEHAPSAPQRMARAIEGALVVNLDDRIPDCERLWALWSTPTDTDAELPPPPALLSIDSEAETLILETRPTALCD